MTETATAPPLGIAALIGATLSLLVRRLPLFLGIALLPALASALLSLALLPTDLGFSRPAARGGGMLTGWQMPALVAVLSILIWLVTTGAVTLAAYDARLGRAPRLGTYLARALGAAPAIVVLGTLYMLAVGVGLMVLLVPGLYLLARYWVMVPAVLVDGAGLGGLSRAAELTRGYRWPIVGLILGVLALNVLLSLVLGLALGAGAFAGAAALGQPAPLLVVADTLITAAQTALMSVFTALLYARLREIKEGLGLENLAEIFA